MQKVEKKYQDKEWLKVQYWKRSLSTLKMAAMAGCSSTTIQNWLAYYKIPIRNLSEAQKAGYDPTTLEGKTRRKKLSKAVKTSWAWGVFDGVFQSPTSIEIAVSDALDMLDIEHEPQYRPNECSRIYDEFAPPNVLIEVQGDYWHSLDKMQRSDAEKAAWAHANGYHLVIIWEHEMHKAGALELVSERVLPLLGMTALPGTEDI